MTGRRNDSKTSKDSYAGLAISPASCFWIQRMTTFHSWDGQSNSNSKVARKYPRGDRPSPRRCNHYRFISYVDQWMVGGTPWAAWSGYSRNVRPNTRLHSRVKATYCPFLSMLSPFSAWTLGFIQPWHDSEPKLIDAQCRAPKGVRLPFRGTLYTLCSRVPPCQFVSRGLWKEAENSASNISFFVRAVRALAKREVGEKPAS